MDIPIIKPKGPAGYIIHAGPMVLLGRRLCDEIGILPKVYVFKVFVPSHGDECILENNGCQGVII